MSHTVLIVDDSKIVRTFVKIQLVKRKFVYVEAADGEEAFELVKSRDLDLIIADLKMPRKDGLSLLAEVRALEDPVRRRIPYILLTADDDAEIGAVARTSGVTAFLQKPVNAAGLLEAVQLALPAAAG